MAASKANALKYYKEMLTIRRMEEKAGQMYQQGKVVGFLHLYIGQEAVAVGSLSNLTDDDYVVTSYRDHAHAYMLGDSVGQVLAELFGKVTGSVRGKGGSMHFFSKKNGLLGGHGIVAGQIPIGTGAGFSLKYKKIKGVSLVYFGDGALSQGIFFESINLAALHNLPVIYILENNEYGMGTAVNRIVANYKEVKKRAEAFGVKTYEVDGMDVFAVEETFDKVIASIRKKPAPAFIKVNTYRYRGHSISDPATYRSKEEVEEYKKKDPINKLKEIIIGKKWATEKVLKDIEKEVKDIINEAVDFAEKSDWPDISEVYDHVYKDQLSVKNYD